MRRELFIFAALLALLAACGPGPAPATPDPNQPGAVIVTEFPTAEPTIPPRQRELFPDVTMPVPGTAVIAATEDAFEGMPFDLIFFERTGGLAGDTLTIEIRPDGTFTRNGIPGTLTAEQAQQFSALVDQTEFFNLEGVFTAPGAGADLYQYSLMVERQGNSRTIFAQDGLIPPQLAQFIQALVTVGEPAQ